MSLKIWLLIIALFLSFLAIAPFGYFEKGVLIKSVEKNSTAFNEGLRPGLIIKEINYQKINNLEDYAKLTIFSKENLPK